MGVIKILYSISNAEYQEIRDEKNSFEVIFNSLQSQSFSFDKFIDCYYQAIHISYNSPTVHLLESGIYVEDKFGQYLECRYIAPSKVNKIAGSVKRIKPEKFCKFAIGRKDYFNQPITNPQAYYDEYLKDLREFLITAGLNDNCLFLVSLWENLQKITFQTF